MRQLRAPSAMTVGLAMFAMFFGSGNLIFPLVVGQAAQEHFMYALMGLFVTAVAIPFIGLMGVLLYEGSYTDFFARLGKIPGFLVSLLILGLLGPFGVIPRCITVIYGSLERSLPEYCSFWMFSLVICLLLYFTVLNQKRILALLGNWLTPVLLLSLGLIISLGFWFAPAPGVSPYVPSAVFVHGLLQGYHTMDLLAAFFFSSIVFSSLKQNFGSSLKGPRELLWVGLKASSIGAVLLGIVYVAFIYLGAAYSVTLEGVRPDQLLSVLALKTLGPYAGTVACIAISLACITTAMTLLAINANFVQKDMSKGRISYAKAVWIVLALSFLVSTLEFNGIAAFLAPILQICYPALIAMTIFNILYKLFQIKMVKMPVLGVFLVWLAACAV